VLRHLSSASSIRVVGRRFAIGLALAAGALGGMPEAAVSHEPYESTLWSGALGQEGRLFSYRETRCGPSDCVIGTALGGPRFPKRALRLGGGEHQAKVVFRVPRRSPTAKVRLWTEIDEDGRPVGSATRIEPEAPEHVHGKKWRVAFVAPSSPPHSYLAVKLSWPNPLGDSDYANFGFHLAD
jgi:hypothetical protein